MIHVSLYFPSLYSINFYIQVEWSWSQVLHHNAAMISNSTAQLNVTTCTLQPWSAQLRSAQLLEIAERAIYATGSTDLIQQFILNIKNNQYLMLLFVLVVLGPTRVVMCILCLSSAVYIQKFMIFLAKLHYNLHVANIMDCISSNCCRHSSIVVVELC